MDNKKKISIICFSGDFDKLIAAFTLATGSAAVNYEVNLFFTFWGLNAVKKNQGRAFLGKGWMARMFNFLMGGLNNVPLSRLNFGGISPKLMTGLMRKRNVATLKELIEAANALGVNLYACEMSMVILGLEKDHFVTELKDVLGVASFLQMSEGGDRMFI